jgi:hypothetical protein
MDVLTELQKFSNKNYDGQFTILKLADCWKILFGIPAHDALYEVLPRFKTAEGAAKFAIDNHLHSMVVEHAWDTAVELLEKRKMIDWDTFLFDLARQSNMSLKDYMIVSYPSNNEEDDD